MSEANTPPVDFLEREIHVGDICIYPVRRGSSMWLNRVTVQSIRHNARGEPSISGIKQDGQMVRVSTMDRVAIVGRNNVIPFQE